MGTQDNGYLFRSYTGNGLQGADALYERPNGWPPLNRPLGGVRNFLMEYLMAEAIRAQRNSLMPQNERKKRTKKNKNETRLR